MKIIVRDGQVIASHEDNQNVLSLYPAGCMEILVPDGTAICAESGEFLAVAEITITEPWPSIRAERDKRLTACDWTQLPDTPLDEASRAAWGAYRQALRDIPQEQADAGGFADIVWPNKPDRD